MKKSYMDKFYDEADDAIEMLNEQCRENPDKTAECRYMKVVLTILPYVQDAIWAAIDRIATEVAMEEAIRRSMQKEGLICGT